MFIVLDNINVNNLITKYYANYKFKKIRCKKITNWKSLERKQVIEENAQWKRIKGNP